jgi:hypothetical protein
LTETKKADDIHLILMHGCGTCKHPAIIKLSSILSCGSGGVFLNTFSLLIKTDVLVVVVVTTCPIPSGPGPDGWGRGGGLAAALCGQTMVASVSIRKLRVLVHLAIVIVMTL